MDLAGIIILILFIFFFFFAPLIFCLYRRTNSDDKTSDSEPEFDSLFDEFWDAFITLNQSFWTLLSCCCESNKVYVSPADLENQIQTDENALKEVRKLAKEQERLSLSKTKEVQHQHQAALEAQTKAQHEMVAVREQVDVDASEVEAKEKAEREARERVEEEKKKLEEAQALIELERKKAEQNVQEAINLKNQHLAELKLENLRRKVMAQKHARSIIADSEEDKTTVIARPSVELNDLAQHSKTQTEKTNETTQENTIQNDDSEDIAPAQLEKNELETTESDNLQEGEKDSETLREQDVSKDILSVSGEQKEKESADDHVISIEEPNSGGTEVAIEPATEP